MAVTKIAAPVRIAVVGCGLIGRRRAMIATADARSIVTWAVDTRLEAAERLAAEIDCQAASDWHQAIVASDVDAVIIATPNAYLMPIAVAALESGKHVLLEKPMGKNLEEACRIEQTARKVERIVKIGFNHRYHPAIAEAHRCFQNGDIGVLRNMRARYGHGGRPGYENEWRGNPHMAGGGELTDQGVHILDLFSWFAGEPERVYAVLQTAVWPIAPLEDNGFALLTYSQGVVASLHTSWTQWKNLFSFEIHGTTGSLTIEGLGKSYGIERLLIAKRNFKGGVPDLEERVYKGEDTSWEHEWNDFLGALTGAAYLSTPAEGVTVMRTLDALYQSARDTLPISLTHSLHSMHALDDRYIEACEDSRMIEIVSVMP